MSFRKAAWFFAVSLGAGSIFSAGPAPAQTIFTSTAQREQLQDQPMLGQPGEAAVNLGLPDHAYDPRQDSSQASVQTFPQTETPAAPPPVSMPSQEIPLGTRSGLVLGVQASDYNYREPGLDVSILGPKLGIEALATAVFGPAFFISGDFRYAAGPVRYKGSGTSNDHLDETLEGRALVGKDFFFDGYSVSPYAGFGYRQLFNDSRGTTSTGAVGYCRLNQLYYVPIGVKPVARVADDARIATMVEYDLVLHGQETSYLSDDGLGDPDIRNQQHSGYGLRGEIMWEMDDWAAGPFINYWNIDTSSPKLFPSGSVSSCQGGTICVGTEPHNHTLEAGAQFRYRFF